MTLTTQELDKLLAIADTPKMRVTPQQIEQQLKAWEERYNVGSTESHSPELGRIVRYTFSEAYGFLDKIERMLDDGYTEHHSIHAVPTFNHLGYSCFLKQPERLFNEHKALAKDRIENDLRNSADKHNAKIDDAKEKVLSYLETEDAKEITRKARLDKLRKVSKS